MPERYTCYKQTRHIAVACLCFDQVVVISMFAGAVLVRGHVWMPCLFKPQQHTHQASLSPLLQQPICKPGINSDFDQWMAHTQANMVMQNMYGGWICWLNILSMLIESKVGNYIGIMSSSKATDDPGHGMTTLNKQGQCGASMSTCIWVKSRTVHLTTT